MKQHLHRLSLFLLILSLVSSLFFLFKVREQNQLIDELINITVKSKNLNDSEQIAISLSREIYRRTRKGINKDDLDLYSRIEGTSFFNVSSGVSYKIWRLWHHRPFSIWLLRDYVTNLIKCLVETQDPKKPLEEHIIG